MKLNTDKCYILLHIQKQNVLKTGYFNLKNCYYEKLLGINFDCKLKFPLDIGDICKEASHKLNGLSRIVPYTYMDLSKRMYIKKNVHNAFLTMRFNYCPLNWIH